MKKSSKEWTIRMPWGNVAVVSWCNPANPPVLLVHGYMDSAATFLLLIDQLPDTYYYVSFDFPGHGKSDPFPPGPLVSQIHLVEVVRRVVEHFKWKQLRYIGHSMGYIIGAVYNCMEPGRISHMIGVDPWPPLATYYFNNHLTDDWYQFGYGAYYTDYDRWNSLESRQYTYDQAIDLSVRSRGISREQAAVVLSRSLVPKGNGNYCFSWQQMVKRLGNLPADSDIMFSIIASRPPPTLCLVATEMNSLTEACKDYGAIMLKNLEDQLSNFRTIAVNGGHDIHITATGICAKEIEEFLQTKHQKAKL